jgi:hypothetical protein
MLVLHRQWRNAADKARGLLYFNAESSFRKAGIYQASLSTPWRHGLQEACSSAFDQFALGNCHLCEQVRSANPPESAKWRFPQVSPE